jgi:hypothetical protein
MRAILAARLALAQASDAKSIPADLVLWQCFEYAPANKLPAKRMRGTIIAKSGFKVVIRIEKDATDGYVAIVTRTPFAFTDPVSGQKVQEGIMDKTATTKPIRAVIGLSRNAGAGET